MDFREATEIAKKNPGSILTRDSAGSFIVQLGDGGVIGATGSNRITDRDELTPEKITELSASLAAKDSIIENLQSDIKSLRDDFEKAISSRLESEKSRLVKIEGDLALQRSVLEEKTKAVQAHLNKLYILEKTYCEKFGEVVVRTVKESVESIGICQRCGGDGGVRGGCQKCDGSGWALSTKITFREVGEIKENDQPKT